MTTDTIRIEAYHKAAVTRRPRWCHPLAAAAIAAGLALAPTTGANAVDSSRCTVAETQLVAVAPVAFPGSAPIVAGTYLCGVKFDEMYGRWAARVPAGGSGDVLGINVAVLAARIPADGLEYPTAATLTGELHTAPALRAPTEAAGSNVQVNLDVRAADPSLIGVTLEFVPVRTGNVEGWAKVADVIDGAVAPTATPAATPEPTETMPVEPAPIVTATATAQTKAPAPQPSTPAPHIGSAPGAFDALWIAVGAGALVIATLAGLLVRLAKRRGAAASDTYDEGADHAVVE
ncbi:hypothetical protein [Microbacterium laevaniformans]|uniref:hypothetical protein n=1 Tax=Microbacterium laevaniformans TaxID=36807 RepID=UPI003D98DF24